MLITHEELAKILFARGFWQNLEGSKIFEIKKGYENRTFYQEPCTIIYFDCSGKCDKYQFIQYQERKEIHTIEQLYSIIGNFKL